MAYPTPTPTDRGYMGDPKRGASLGRPSTAMQNLDVSQRISLRHIPLDSGGYDRGGSYWGHHQRLYCAMDHNGETVFFRAKSREAAKAHVRDEHDTPEQVRFFR